LNPIALHMLSCHVPFVGGGFALALLLYGLARRDDSLTRAADYAVVIVALGSAVAWATGPATLAALQKWIDPAAQSFADRHESLGDVTMVAWTLAAALALWGVFLRRAKKAAPRWRAPALAALIVTGLGLAAWAAHEGGRIRHDELRHGVDTTVIAGEQLDP
jgi:uncharacterized membrane protein